MTCSHLRRKIRMSIAAVVILFMLGGMVFGSSLMWFETKVKAEPIPKSMIEQPAKQFDSSLWTVMLLVCAGVGLPLGMYVLTTLHDCEALQEKLDQSSL